MAERKKSKGKVAFQRGAPASDHDPQKMGNFSGAGEHPLQGGRTTGIVGQTKQRVHTDLKQQGAARAASRATKARVKTQRKDAAAVAARAKKKG